MKKEKKGKNIWYKIDTILLVVFIILVIIVMVNRYYCVTYISYEGLPFYFNNNSSGVYTPLNMTRVNKTIDRFVNISNITNGSFI